MQKMLLFVAIAAIAVSPAWSAEYDRILSEMNKILDSDPSYTQMFDIGKNDQGDTIYGLRVENPNYQEPDARIAHLLVGVHHGNERNTSDMCVLFVKNLIKIYKDAQHPHNKSLSRCTFYVVPVLNIGGFNSSRRSERNASGSYVDPNRDYPDACVHNTYFQLASVRNLVAFVEKYDIVGSVTAHGYIGTFTYPWGIYTSNTKTLDHSFYNTAAAQSVKANGYRIGTHSDVIYPASGSYEDWAYHKHGVWTMLLELASSANLEKDSQCVLTYFALLPTARSSQHQHTGTCTQTRGDEGDSRP